MYTGVKFDDLMRRHCSTKQMCQYLELHESRCVSVNNLVLDVFRYTLRVHIDRWHEVKKNVIAVGLLGVRVTKSHFKFV